MADPSGSNSPGAAPPWRIDRAVAAALTDALGWSAADGLAALAQRIPERLPCGSTAKLEALAAGGVPPGADVDHLAGAVLAHLADPGGTATGGSPSWSCWVLAGLTAAVLEASGIPAGVAITRRIDAEAPPVDFHSVVLAGPPGERWILQPYFGLAAPLPDEPPPTLVDPLEPCPERDRGGTVPGTVPHGTLRATAGADGRLEVEEHLRRWPNPLRYRLLATDVDRGDVAAMAAISATHTGVPFRPYARIHRPDGRIVDVREGDDGRFLITIWTPAPTGPTTTETDHPAWSAAAEAFHELTGVALR